MFTNPSPLVYPTGAPSQSHNPYLTQAQSSPEMEMIMRRKWNESQQQVPMQPDPYMQFQNEMSQCSPTVKNKIMNDSDYIQADNQCEALLKQAIEEAIIPQLINTPNGRVAFERLTAITRNLKQKYIQDEVIANEQLQALMKDEVVINRLKELQTNTPLQSKARAPRQASIQTQQTTQTITAHPITTPHSVTEVIE